MAAGAAGVLIGSAGQAQTAGQAQSGGQVAAAPAPAAPASIQAQFDAAENLWAARDWEKALAAFRALETRLKTTQRTGNRGVVRVRIGDILYNLNRDGEALEALFAGIADIPLDNANLASNRTDAQLYVAQILERQIDYPGASKAYAAFAEAVSGSPMQAVLGLAGEVRTTYLADPDRAIALATRAIATVEANDPKNDELKAQLITLRGRATMATGRFDAAETDLKRAVKLLGGLTQRVNQADLQARSDLAIAAMLAGHEDVARENLAYTGQGRFDVELGAQDITPPACGGTAALKPEDVAVVEFAIGEDGVVRTAIPIYSSNRAAGLEFARAALGWSWKPEAAAKLPGLFRVNARVEMRCTTQLSAPSIMSLLADDANRWFQPARPIAAAGSNAARLAPLRAELARREQAHGAQSRETLEAMLTLAGNSLIAPAEWLQLTIRAEAAAQALDAPPAVRVIAGLQRSWAESAGKGWSRGRGKVQALHRLIADPAIARDRLAGPALAILIADASEDAAAKPHLQRVIDFPGIEPNNPMRTAALIRLASIELREGDRTAAAAMFQQSGVGASQCALFDAQPALKSGSIGSGAFPNEAIRWGFDGFVLTEYDIDANGTPTPPRAVVAYPPFVFGAATTKAIARFRYEPTFRPDGGKGCTAQRQRVTYRMP